MMTSELTDYLMYRNWLCLCLDYDFCIIFDLFFTGLTYDDNLPYMLKIVEETSSIELLGNIVSNLSNEILFSECNEQHILEEQNIVEQQIIGETRDQAKEKESNNDNLNSHSSQKGIYEIIQ